jgi:hypothetical protein
MDCGRIYLVDKKTGDLNLFMHHGLSPEFINSVVNHKSDSLYSKIVKEGKTVLTQYPKITDNTIELQEGILATAMVPFIYRNEVIGCINISSHKKEGIQKN